MSINIASFLRMAEQQLAKACVDNPSFDARFLLGHILGLNRGQLFSQSERILSAEEHNQALALIDRRANYEPVARILGEREFWGLSFCLNEATLEPRPDSEILIETALKCLPRKDSKLRLLDLGTGSGCLLLSMLHELPNATGLGIDIAPRAIEQAQKNAERLSLNHRAIFKMNNWLDGMSEPFDLIIANPPYIEDTDLAALMPEVRNHDPALALDGGPDGLMAYRLIISQLPRFLNSGAFVVFEVGYNQSDAVTELFEQNGFINITKHKDLGGINRCLTAHMP